MVDLQTSIAALLELKKISGGPEYRREVARTALLLLEKLKKIDPRRKQAILAEIDHWQNVAYREGGDV